MTFRTALAVALAWIVEGNAVSRLHETVRLVIYLVGRPDGV
jgi:hypothetical protein